MLFAKRLSATLLLLLGALIAAADNVSNDDITKSDIAIDGADSESLQQNLDSLRDKADQLGDFDTHIEEDLDADLYDENFDNGADNHQEKESETQQSQGHWGTPPTIENNSGSAMHSHTFVKKDKIDKNHTTNATRNSLHPHPHIQTITHPPPEAFTITAKIKQRGGKSYFDINSIDDARNSIPFMECNSVGTTTPPIPAGSVSFRSFPRSGHPSLWTYTHGFIVPLSSIIIEVQTVLATDSTKNKQNTSSIGDGNEDKKQIFNAGEVIWVDGQYRMSSAGENDLTALIIEIPKKEGGALDIFGVPKGTSGEKVNRLNCNDTLGVVKNLAKDVRKNVPIRRITLASLGLSLSSMLTYFWVKVAPLQLAVGIGGTCLIAGGSLGIIKGGEYLCDEFEAYFQKVREEREALEEAYDEEETASED